MPKFAKLFDLEDNEQVLVIFTQTEEGEPALDCITNIDGGEQILRIGFGSEGDSAWDKAGTYMDTFDEEGAKLVRKVLVDKYNSLDKEEEVE